MDNKIGEVKLTVGDGVLCLHGKPLIHYFPTGEHDMVPWPIDPQWWKNLATCLREIASICNDLGDDTEEVNVILPDGSVFGRVVGYNFCPRT